MKQSIEAQVFNAIMSAFLLIAGFGFLYALTRPSSDTTFKRAQAVAEKHKKVIKEFKEVMLAQGVTLTVAANESVVGLNSIGVNHVLFNIEGAPVYVLIMGNNYKADQFLVYKNCQSCDLKLVIYRNKDTKEKKLDGSTITDLEVLARDIDLEDAVIQRRLADSNKSLHAIVNGVFATPTVERDIFATPTPLGTTATPVPQKWPKWL